MLCLLLLSTSEPWGNYILESYSKQGKKWVEYAKEIYK
jgi:hypothetical protein